MKPPRRPFQPVSTEPLLEAIRRAIKAGETEARFDWVVYHFNATLAKGEEPCGRISRTLWMLEKQGLVRATQRKGTRHLVTYWSVVDGGVAEERRSA